MNSIVRGTTPTIKWKFSTVNLDSIIKAFLIIRKGQEAVIEKDISDAIFDTEEKTVSWVLTQSDTLGLEERKKYAVHLDWVLADETRGAGKTIVVDALPPGKNEVIGNG